jgi:SAM-dependent methyltransferase
VLEHLNDILTAIEADSTLSNRTAVVTALRRAGLDDFASVLWTIPNPAYPRISALLPSMVSDEIQKAWTGASGDILIRGTSAFVRAVVAQYVRLTGRILGEGRVLDFGCGYGRIARLMYYFSDPNQVFGVDPWDKSIALCRGHNMGENFVQSDYLPIDLPLPGTAFSLVYAFSVFTHLSEKATLLCLRTLRSYISPDGLLVITIRPIEYWSFACRQLGREKSATDELERRHRTSGFAFDPHRRAPIEGEVTYGDTSMTLDWLESHACGWRVECIDRSLEDPLQIYVFLRPV